MSLSRRSLLAAGALVPAAGLTGLASAAFAGSETPARTGTPLIGYSVPPAGSGLPTLEDTERLTGRHGTVLRMYVKKNTNVPASCPSGVLTYLQQGRAVSLSLRPIDGSATNVANARSLAADIAARGYADNMWVTLWAEPNRDLDPARYRGIYTALYPAFREHGISVGPCFQMYPYYQKGIDWIADWYTGDDTADCVHIDVYPGDKTGTMDEDPLGVVAPLTRYAKDHGKTFAIAECGVSSEQAAADPAAAVTWIEKFENLGGSCEYLTYYIGQDYPLTGPLVPAYRQLYDHFA